MKKSSSIVVSACLISALVLPLIAHALPAVQRTATAEAQSLPALQYGWLGAVLAQLNAMFGG